MNILIYDDNRDDINVLVNCIENLFNLMNIFFSIRICENTEEFLTTAQSYDIIFLDIEIGQENGISLGSKIKTFDGMPRIIITSKFKKYLIDGYKIHADRFFIKPIKQKEFNIEMNNIISEYFNQHIGIIDLSISNYTIYLKDIIYIEFLGRKTFIHLSKMITIETPYTLKYWVDRLTTYSFAQPHKSFLVNFRYIDDFMKTDVILKNGYLIPLSRHFKKEFENKYIDDLHKVI